MTEPKQPERVESRAPDEYERKYMGAEQSLARARKAMPWWFHGILGGAATFLATMAVLHHTPQTLIGVPVLALTWLVLSHVRLAVTSTHVHVQYGLFGPKIPIDAIVSAEAKPYPFMRYGGWGIRRSLDGSWAYSVPGGTGLGVEITYRRGGGLRTVFVSADNAHEIVAAIERARGGAGGGVRVAIEATAGEVETVARDEAAPGTHAKR